MSKKPEHVLVRFSAPSRLDKFPFGTRWVMMVNDDEATSALYIQTSLEEQSPTWERLELFLETVFQEFFGDDFFIEECLRLYKSQREKNRALLSINNMLKDKI